jgi:RNA-directed DNA polymerase
MPVTPKPLRVLFDAIHHGKYDFHDFLHLSVATSYSEFTFDRRTVYKPTKKLKAYHDFLNTFVLEFLTINPRVVYSYRKGTNAQQAVAKHAHGRAFFQTDLLNFFASIDRDLVRSTLTGQGSQIPVTDLSAHLDRILDLTTIDGRLPVGFSTSPLISNACLTAFDDDVEAHCRSNELTYTRYADDIVISAQERAQLQDIETVLHDRLASHFAGKLQLNDRKSRHTTIGRRIKILGMIVTPSGQVTIDNDLKARIEALLHYYVTDREKFSSMVGHDVKAGMERLVGYINYVNTADKAYLGKLRRKYGTTVIDSFLHRSAT